VQRDGDGLGVPYCSGGDGVLKARRDKVSDARREGRGRFRVGKRGLRKCSLDVWL
jgi:hypothetical protein